MKVEGWQYCISSLMQSTCSCPWAWDCITQNCSGTLLRALPPGEFPWYTVCVPTCLPSSTSNSQFIFILNPIFCGFWFVPKSYSIKAETLCFLINPSSLLIEAQHFYLLPVILPDKRRSEKPWGHRRHQCRLLLPFASYFVCLFLCFLCVFVKSSVYKDGLCFLTI